MVPKREGERMSSGEGGQVSGTPDKDYNLIWFTEQCLSNALRMETYAQDADRDGDSELAEFFRRAQAESKKGASQGKSMLGKRLSG
jgi:hypothetical protein